MRLVRDAKSQSAAPKLAVVTPFAGPASGGTAVTLRGEGFADGASVTFGGVAASGVSVPDSTTILVATPAHASGSVDVTVTNPDGQKSALAGAFTYGGAGGICTADDGTLCLFQGRFKVQASFKDYGGTSGSGRAQAISSDSGYFWFFEPGNVEVVAKIVNSCSYGSNLSIYASGLTDVETTIKVTDTKNGTYKEYRKQLGQRFTTIADAPFSCP